MSTAVGGLPTRLEDNATQRDREHLGGDVQHSRVAEDQQARVPDTRCRRLSRSDKSDPMRESRDARFQAQGVTRLAA